jgi:hypothetical protein
MSPSTTTFDGDDLMTSLIESAIGPNDAYPKDVQLAAHRAKQELKEKYFSNQDTTEKTL